MEFAPSERVATLLDRVRDFMREHVDPVEREALEALDREVRAGHRLPRDPRRPARARAGPRDCGTCSCRTTATAPGSSTGSTGCSASRWAAAASRRWSSTARRPTPATWRSSPSTGPTSRRSAGCSRCSTARSRSCFSMTEPDTAGSDPTGLVTRAELDGDEWVINGHKWFTSGYNGAGVAIAMVVTDPDAPPHKRASMILVPVDTPGFTGVRPVPVMGHDEGPGHWEVLYEDCRVPADNLLGPRGAGFRDRPGPARPGAHPPLHARDRLGRARLRADVHARARPRGVRRAAGGQAVRPGLRRQVAHGDRPGAADGAARRLEDGHRGQARGAPGDLDDQGDRRPDAPARARPRDAGARRARHVRRHAARRDVAPGPLAADRGRARRGPQDGHRGARAEPLPAYRHRAGPARRSPPGRKSQA